MLDISGAPIGNGGGGEDAPGNGKDVADRDNSDGLQAAKGTLLPVGLDELAVFCENSSAIGVNISSSFRGRGVRPGRFEIVKSESASLSTLRKERDGDGGLKRWGSCVGCESRY